MLFFVDFGGADTRIETRNVAWNIPMAQDDFRGPFARLSMAVRVEEQNASTRSNAFVDI
jgi:hypothetical protein